MFFLSEGCDNMSNMNTVEIGKRITECREKLGERQGEFAASAGISRSYLSKVETGVQQPSFDMIYKLVTNRNISIDWLITGIGQMFLIPDDHIFNKLDDEDIEIMELFHSLNADRRIRIWQAIKLFLQDDLSK